MIWINAVLNDVAVEQAPTAAVERRAVARTATNHERSRLLARRMQRSFVLAAVACFAHIIVSTVQSALARPMALLSTAMAPEEAASN